MSAIFGFFDPELGSRRDLVAARMARALIRPPGSETAIQSSGLGCLGIAYSPGGRRDAWLRIEANGVIRARLGRLFTGREPDGQTPRERGLPPAMLEGLRGHFALASLDPEQEKLCLASDHFGTRPIYIYRRGRALYFASQVKAILAALEQEWRLDPVSVASMLSFAEMLGNRTLVDGIRTLPAGTVLAIGREGSVSNPYWRYRYAADDKLGWSEAVDSTGRALVRAVEHALAEHAHPAVPLSGGLDSRFVLELAAAGSHPMAYTWGLPGCRDIRCAGVAASLLRSPHQVFLYEPDYLAGLGDRGVWITEGHAPATNFHVLPFVDRLAAGGHDVLLDGFAGDGILGGNFISDAWLRCKDLRVAAAALWLWRRKAFGGGRERLLGAEQVELARDEFAALFCGYPGDSSMDRAMAFLIDNRVRRTTTCGSEIFRSRIPVGQPFMDVDVIAAVSRVPHLWRKRHRFYLAVFKAFAPRSAAAPYQRTMLPAQVPYGLTWLSLAGQRAVETMANRLGLEQPFAGKSPSDFPTWFRGPLRAYVEGVLGSERCLDRGTIPPDMVRRVLTEHQSRIANHANLMGAMLSLELFCRVFLDDFPGSIDRFSDRLAASPAELLPAA